MPAGMVTKFAAHGMEQKYGDECSSTKDKPLSEEDMACALDDLDEHVALCGLRAVHEPDAHRLGFLASYEWANR